MAQEVFLRSAAGVISADKFDDHMSPFKPVSSAKSAVFIREESDINALNTPAPGSSGIRWEIPKSGDYIDKLWLKWTVPQYTISGGTATYVRLADYAAYAAIREIRLLYGECLHEARSEIVY